MRDMKSSRKQLLAIILQLNRELRKCRGQLGRARKDIAEYKVLLARSENGANNLWHSLYPEEMGR